MAYKITLLASGKNLMSVGGVSAFSREVHAIIAQRRPKKIIETGTYLGTGTTSIILSSLQQAGITDAEFYTIEVNPVHHKKAQENLQGAPVNMLLGLSIPRAMLPTVTEIERDYVYEEPKEDVFVDNFELTRATEYFKETNYAVPDDMLGMVLKKFDNKPDFVLLDSAGHMGIQEYDYVQSRLAGPCIMALDDTDHVKHFKSVQRMKADPRFKILVEVHEKFGFVIAEFNPNPR